MLTDRKNIIYKTNECYTEPMKPRAVLDEGRILRSRTRIVDGRY